jgi:enterochelin esterase-like enzyme
MSNSNREIHTDTLLGKLRLNLLHAESKAEADKAWSHVECPFIEDIPNDSDNKLVTFLYRMDPSSKKNQTKIYLYSAIVPPLSDESCLIEIPGSGILHLSLTLPSTLRTTYSFLRIDDETNIDNSKPVNISPHYPAPTGEFKTIQDLLAKLYEHGKVEIDSYNQHKIVYYIDPDNLEQFFAMESILELPMAPKQLCVPSSLELVREERNDLKKKNRFLERSLQFSNTSLKDDANYNDKSRKYWIYLPPDYDANKTYSLMLFLDGGEFIDTIPTQSILEKLITDNIIPPSIVVFFDYSMDRRQQEYYCDNHFTQFIAKDFMSTLRDKDHLSITNDSRLVTIVGLSFSGLAAFYAALTHPDVFGNSVTFSASFESVKRDMLDKLIDLNHAKNHDSQYLIETGSYENLPVELQFQDGTTQAFSINQANKHVFESLNQHGINARKYEFVGGHNSICYRNSLPDRLIELYEFRLKNQIQNTMGNIE